ncbi:MAG: ankyrin repeat domain-containing protein [Gammaproteobacteria bacterium]
MSDSRSDKTTNEKLIDALWKGNYEAACGLIKDCKDINGFDRPILYIAVAPHHKSAEGVFNVEKQFDLLINAGLDLHKNNNGIEALLSVIARHYWPSNNPLIRQQRINIINKILDHKIDVNSVLTEYVGHTALHVAAEDGDEEFCQLLLKRGASLCSVYKDLFSDTPIAAAFRNNHLELADALLEVAVAQAKEKKCDLTAAMGNSILSVLTKDRLSYFKKLLVLKANVNAQDRHKRTALHRIAERAGSAFSCIAGHHKELLSLLFEAEIDATIKDRDGNTAMQSAVKSWNHPANFEFKLLYKFENRQLVTRALNNLLVPPLIKITNEYAVDETIPFKDEWDLFRGRP